MEKCYVNELEKKVLRHFFGFAYGTCAFSNPIGDLFLDFDP